MCETNETNEILIKLLTEINDKLDFLIEAKKEELELNIPMWDPKKKCWDHIELY